MTSGPPLTRRSRCSLPKFVTLRQHLTLTALNYSMPDTDELCFLFTSEIRAGIVVNAESMD